MIGQDKLLNRIAQYTWESFPSAVILEGAFGCGKHTLCQQLANTFEVLTYDMSLDVTDDFILACYTKRIPILYYIDINKVLTAKQDFVVQNALLKFIEEPPEGAKIIILCNNRNQLLITIQNRCQIFVFEKYSHDELQQFTSQPFTDMLFDIYDTPGKILSITSTQSTTDLIALCTNIVENIHKASIPNVLTILKRLDLGGGEGYNLQIFIACIKHVLLDKLKTSTENIKYFKYYQLTKQLSEQLTLLNINVSLLVEHYLLELKGI